MEVFVKVISENLMTGERQLAATSFLTFVALSKEGKALTVPYVRPVSEEEIMMNESAPMRAENRKKRREHSKTLGKKINVNVPWG
jgi:acyl-CoA hydrolase